MYSIDVLEIKKNTPKDALCKYRNSLDIKYKPNYKDLTIEERYKIAAYVGYYYGLMYEKCIGTPCDCNSFGASLYYDKSFMAFIKRNNYFGLKGFKKIIEEQYDRYQEGVAVLEHRSSGE